MTDKLDNALANVSSISLQVTKEDLIDYAIEQQLAPRKLELSELIEQRVELYAVCDESKVRETKCANKLMQVVIKGNKAADALAKAIKAFSGEDATVRSENAYLDEVTDDWFCHVSVSGCGGSLYVTGDRLELKSKQLTKLRAESKRLKDEYNELSGRINVLTNQVSVEAISDLRTQLRTKIVETAMKSANGELHKLLEAPKS